MNRSKALAMLDIVRKHDLSGAIEHRGNQVIGVIVLIPWFNEISGETGVDRELASTWASLRQALGYTEVEI